MTGSGSGKITVSRKRYRRINKDYEENKNKSSSSFRSDGNGCRNICKKICNPCARKNINTRNDIKIQLAKENPNLDQEK
jgi:hypothetical protein